LVYELTVVRVVKICFITGWLNHQKYVPLVLAANRDEEYARGGEPPAVNKQASYSYLVPRDPRAGGTWIGINSAGLLAALTNKPAEDSNPGNLSRGKIITNLLGNSGSTEQSKDLLDDMELQNFQNFSVVTIDPHRFLYFSTVDNSITVEEHKEGSFFLSNQSTFEFFTPREVVKFPWGAHSGEAKPERLRGRLQNFCRQHRSFHDHGELCRHGEKYGTVSSSIIVLDLERERLIYDVTEGAPCEATYYPVDIPAHFESSVLSAWRDYIFADSQGD